MFDWNEIRHQAPHEAAASLQGILASLEGTEERIFAVRGMAGLIAEEMQAGYTLEGRPIRHAMVKVTRQ